MGQTLHEKLLFTITILYFIFRNRKFLILQVYFRRMPLRAKESQPYFIPLTLTPQSLHSLLIWDPWPYDPALTLCHESSSLTDRERQVPCSHHRISRSWRNQSAQDIGCGQSVAAAWQFRLLSFLFKMVLCDTTWRSSTSNHPAAVRAVGGLRT